MHPNAFQDMKHNISRALEEPTSASQTTTQPSVWPIERHAGKTTIQVPRSLIQRLANPLPESSSAVTAVRVALMNPYSQGLVEWVLFFRTEASASERRDEARRDEMERREEKRRGERSRIHQVLGAGVAAALLGGDKRARPADPQTHILLAGHIRLSLSHLE